MAEPAARELEADVRQQAASSRGLGRRLLELTDALAIPVLSVVTGFIVAGLIIAISDPVVLRTLRQSPVAGLRTGWDAVYLAYYALWNGSIGSPAAIVRGLALWIGPGDNAAFLRAIRPISESLVNTTPLIFAGLAVALGFRGGLFNIGVEGQLFVSALAGSYVGYAVTGLPWIVHLPLTLAIAFVAGGLWGAIPGFLKAKTGAHEVINTIMLNWIAFRLSDYLLTGPMKREGFVPITPQVLPSAYLPQFLPQPIRFHAGFFLALGLAAFVWWLLWKTPIGFEIRTVGANPRAARYAGISVAGSFVLTMFLSGAIGGLAGIVQVLGVQRAMAVAFSAGYGFDAIALALLGKSHPLGVILASLLFGVLRTGATRMQSVADIPVDIISILQAVVLMFVAAPAMIRWLYRVRVAREAEEATFTRGWGQL